MSNMEDHSLFVDWIEEQCGSGRYYVDIDMSDGNLHVTDVDCDRHWSEPLLNICSETDLAVYVVARGISFDPPVREGIIEIE